MKNTAQKREPNNVLSLVDNARFKAKQTVNGELFSHKMMANLFQFQIGDSIICRPYRNEELSLNAIVICHCEQNGKHLTTVANAVKITGVVVAYRREVIQ